MQKWLLMVGALGLMVVGSVARAQSEPNVQPIKDPNGTTLAVLVQCNSCPSASATSKKCHPGAEEGYLDGQPCGKCMIAENYGAHFAYPFDLHFKGKLVDAKGEPIKNRFVKVFLSNGWSVRTRTSDEGTYRVMLGATAERKGNTPLVVDVGTRTDDPKENKDYYSMFVLPDAYKACSASAAPQPKSKKAKAKK